MYKHITVILLLLLVAAIPTRAQVFDPLSLFGKGKPLKLSGGINASTLYNYTSGTQVGGQPFTYVIGGNLNTYYRGISIPIDFTYSNLQFSYRFQPIPFNKIAIHPHYKFVTLHAGTIALNFSPYTLNGFQFNGAGLELTPGKWKLMALGGKFLKGSGDYLKDPEAIPTYARYGQGLAGTYQLGGIVVGANVFHAKDATGSASNIPVEQGITPRQNLVSSFVSSGTLLQSLRYSGEFAHSLMTEDLAAVATYGGHHLFSGLVKRNATTTGKNAANLNLSYTFKQIGLGANYERVEFNYQTLGSLYTVNGFENTGFTVQVPLLKGRLNLSSQVGIQRDLTDDTAFSQKSGRQLLVFNFTYAPVNKLSFNGSYSNNKGVTNVRNLDNIANQNNLVPYYLDSLRLVQVNQNANLNANYQLLSTSEESRALSATYSYQKGDQKQGDYFLDLQGTQFQNATLSLFTLFPKTEVKWNISLAYSSVHQGPDSNKTNAMGVNCNFGKKFFHKTLALMVGSGYNSTKTVASALRVNVFNLKLTGGYTYHKKHVLNLNAIFQNQAKQSLILPQTSNTTAVLSVTYNYNFF